MVTRRQVRRAIELHGSELAARADVVGIGAEWDTGKRGGDGPRRHAVAVYVADDPGPRSPEPAIPTTLEIPARTGVHRIPVVIRRIGVVEPEEGAGRPDPAGDDPPADPDGFAPE
jgi:hypothetical protein